MEAYPCQVVEEVEAYHLPSWAEEEEVAYLEEVEEAVACLQVGEAEVYLQVEEEVVEAPQQALAGLQKCQRPHQASDLRSPYS